MPARSRRWRFRYGLKSLFVLTTIACAALGAWYHWPIEVEIHHDNAEEVLAPAIYLNLSEPDRWRREMRTLRRAGFGDFVQHGSARFFDKHGGLREEVQWRDGVLEGEVTFFHGDGSSRATGRISDGCFTGTWTGWDEHAEKGVIRSIFPPATSFRGRQDPDSYPFIALPFCPDTLRVESGQLIWATATERMGSGDKASMTFLPRESRKVVTQFVTGDVVEEFCAGPRVGEFARMLNDPNCLFPSTRLRCYGANGALKFEGFDEERPRGSWKYYDEQGRPVERFVFASLRDPGQVLQFAPLLIDSRHQIVRDLPIPQVVTRLCAFGPNWTEQHEWSLPQRVFVAARSESLSLFLARLSKRHHIKFHFDRLAMLNAGVAPDTRVTVDARGLPLRVTLCLALHPLGLTCVPAADGNLRVTSWKTVDDAADHARRLRYAAAKAP